MALLEDIVPGGGEQTPSLKKSEEQSNHPSLDRQRDQSADENKKLFLQQGKIE